MTAIIVKMTLEERDLINTVAKAQKTTVAEIVRTYLKEYTRTHLEDAKRSLIEQANNLGEAQR